MSTKKPITAISIEPLQYTDIPECSRITAAAFSTDQHTIVKQLGRKPFDVEVVSREGFLHGLNRKNQVYVKAIDKETGEIVGHAGWGFRGVDEEKIPRRAPFDSPPPKEKEPKKNGDPKLNSHDKGGEEGNGNGNKDKRDSIDRLHKLEDEDMQHWMKKLMPPGTSCMFIIGLIVSPGHQSHGIGSQLITHGAYIADKLGLFTWVHSLDQAWRAYGKFGFEIIGELDVDLDEYAPEPPKEENGFGEKWGHYVIRYMKRLPKVSEA